MSTYAVITGDISNFTQLPDGRRNKLVIETEKLMATMVNNTKDAQVFRGDSYQLIINDITTALKKCIQLICWFKINSDQLFTWAGKHKESGAKVRLGTRLSIGVGQVAYQGKNVLDSDGEAFHLSGRQFDKLNKNDIIRLTTIDERLNGEFEILLMFMNSIIKSWSTTQAQTIFQLLEDESNTQEKIAKELNMSQPAIALSLRASKWKEIEKGMNYINKQLTNLYLQ